MLTRASAQKIAQKHSAFGAADSGVMCILNQAFIYIMKFNHIGIPVTDSFEGEIDLPHLKMTVSDHENNPYGIQWQRYWKDAPYPELVKTVPHVAFVVDNLDDELKNKNVIIQPNSPSDGLRVAFIEVNGAPVELMEYS